jgi:MYXO-CTERM domain-containing protein
MQIGVEAAQKGNYDPPFWALSGKSDPSTEPPLGTGGSGGSGGSAGTGGSSGSGGAIGDPQGSACPCPSGFQCVNDGVSPQNFCTATCDKTRACGDGFTCIEDGVCMAPQNDAADSSGGCSVGSSGERGPAKPVPWVFALAAAAVFGRYRRR